MIPSNPLASQSIPPAAQHDETATTGFSGLAEVSEKTVRSEVSPAAARFIAESPSAVVAIHRFVPPWLRIDLRQGSLRGEFSLA